MKNVLLASTALMMLTSAASAEIALSGTARMGIIDSFGDSDAAFTSRIRIIFTASGETDGGLAFGGTVRNDQSGVGGTENGDSVVFISGAFGKFSMGDVDGAAAAAVGQVSGVGLTGLNDLNEIAYVLGEEDTSALLEYQTGAFGFYLSSSNDENLGLGANYTTGNYKFGIGYETVEDGSIPGSGWPDKIGFGSSWPNGVTQWVIGADATFGAFTAKARYARYDEDNSDGIMNQTAVSVDYAMDALVLTGFYSNFRGADGYEGDDGDFYGVGASYDLGGGAKVVGGYSSADGGALGNDDAFDFGLSFSF